MKPLFVSALLSAAILASTSANPADAREESVAPTKLVGRGSKPQRLISSDLDGRELQFITAALRARDTLAFLAEEASKSAHPMLRTLGEELQKNLPVQTAVLSTLAEMKKVAPPEKSSQHTALEKKLAGMKGARLEKALMDALLEANTEFVTTCEAGLRSSDKSARQFAEQTLPYARGTLARVQAMAGIAPRRVSDAANPPPVAAGPAGAPKPGFRANIRAKGTDE